MIPRNRAECGPWAVDLEPLWLGHRGVERGLPRGDHVPAVLQHRGGVLVGLAAVRAGVALLEAEAVVHAVVLVLELVEAGPPYLPKECLTDTGCFLLIWTYIEK